MKYIITESRFAEIISKYLDDTFENIQEYYDEIDGVVYNWWGIKQDVDIPVFVLQKNYDGKMGIAYDEQLLNSLMNLFGITQEEAESHLQKWININLNIYPEFKIEQTF